MQKKLFVLLNLLILSTAIQADECQSSCDYECDQNWCDECVPGYLPPALPDGCGLFVGADFLYWNACENDLDYVQTSSDDTKLKGSLKFVEYDWDPGFRIYGGYRWGCDGWDARMIYTYFESDDHDQTINVDETNSLDTYLLHSLSVPLGFDPDKVAASVDLNYETLDFLFSRSCCVSPSLIARPYFGFRGFWIDRDFDVLYAEESVIRKINWSSDTDGYGIHAGIDWNVNLCGVCEGLGFNAFFAGSLLAAQSEVHHRQSSDSETFVDVKEEQRIALPGYHLGLNFSWDICSDCAYVILAAGYEFNYWDGLPQLRRYSESESIENCFGRSGSATNGKLLVHGLTVSGEVHY